MVNVRYGWVLGTSVDQVGAQAGLSEALNPKLYR